MTRRPTIVTPERHKRLVVPLVSLRHYAVRIRGLVLQPLAHRAWYLETELKLTPEEYRFLVSLALNAGTVVPDDVLEAEVWDDYPVPEHAVTRLVHRLRGKLMRVGIISGRDLIRSVYGVGYIIDLD